MEETKKVLLGCVLAAKMMVYLDSSTETKAAELAAALDESLENRTIQVHLNRLQHYNVLS